MKEIMELVGVSTAERPIKGFALDKALYVANTKQDVLDEQAISNERVANLVVWARDIKKFMVFNVDGSSHSEKDFPSGDVDVSDLASLTDDNSFKGNSTYEGSTSQPKSIMTKEAVEGLIPESSYDGDGFGVPQYEWTSSGTVIQTQITAYYKNNSTEAGDLKINCRTDNGAQNWRFYYWLPKSSLPSRKIYVTVDEKAGANKMIRSGEVWQVEVKAGRFSDTFYWSRIDDGTNTYVVDAVDAYLISNLSALVDSRMNEKEIKSPFTNAQSIQIDVSHLDHPDVTVYVTDGSKLKKVKPAIQRDLVTGHLQIDFISPKTGLIVIRSH